MALIRAVEASSKYLGKVHAKGRTSSRKRGQALRIVLPESSLLV
jgi:hypothetical protein